MLAESRILITDAREIRNCRATAAKLFPFLRLSITFWTGTSIRGRQDVGGRRRRTSFSRRGGPSSPRQPSRSTQARQAIGDSSGQRWDFPSRLSGGSPKMVTEIGPGFHTNCSAGMRKSCRF